MDTRFWAKRRKIPLTTAVDLAQVGQVFDITAKLDSDWQLNATRRSSLILGVGHPDKITAMQCRAEHFI